MLVASRNHFLELITVFHVASCNLSKISFFLVSGLLIFRVLHLLSLGVWKEWRLNSVCVVNLDVFFGVIFSPVML